MAAATGFAARLALLAGLLAGALLPAARPVMGQPLDPQLARRTFLALAFGNEFFDETGQHIKKWAGPIKIKVYGASRNHYLQIVYHTRTLSRLTGLEFFFGDRNARGANFVVAFMSPEAFRARLGNGGEPHPRIRYQLCLGTVYVGPNGVIKGANIYILDTISDTDKTTCIHEEIAQSLGLLNDATGSEPTIFNDNEAHVEMTPYDRLLLKVLYDERIRPGMAPDEVDTVLDAVIADKINGVAPE